ncbi:hypothetical protein H5410_046061 [Solanum commersonii]|uniref:Uncharacterized protein n=1 Tax=Solanum commersonii TaxID=4109 RepID=A0A9J5XB82_SOLCO|nr:hypothetical protein H5410_046061 [Solanum commersonii]
MKTTNHSALVQGLRKIKKTKLVQLVEKGNMHSFELWDFTEESNPKNDEATYIVKMKPCKDYTIVCAHLFENCGLRCGDEIEVCWDSNSHNFKFNLIN